jgi:hypothetical protein
MTLYLCHEISPGGLLGPHVEIHAHHPREAAVAYARDADKADAGDPTLPASLLERNVSVRHPGERVGRVFVITRETRPAYHAREA